MINCLFVGLGGFIGSVARYLMGLISIPTIVINIAGAFLIGVISALALKNSSFDPHLLLFLRVGICGGFTTFSTFSLDAVELLRTGSVLTGVLYMVLSVVLCLLATVAGQAVVR
ncbi:MAG: CrcB family protein [Clostridiales bacterium]|nr:CrcB family protein [Clostridiales bacterium]MDY2920873.1 CrcB family protein [Lentihominibacter sp.]